MDPLNVRNLIGKRYYELSNRERQEVAHVFKHGQKFGMKLVVELPPNADDKLKDSLKNGIWGIQEMNHKDALGVVVKIENVPKPPKQIYHYHTDTPFLTMINAATLAIVLAISLWIFLSLGEEFMQLIRYNSAK
jgi:hypothetical protein